MPCPTIRFRQDGGTISAASGAGPNTAVTGTVARTRAAGSTRVGLFETGAVDLSLVNVSGIDAAGLNTGSGRKLSKVTAKKTTRQATTGNITTGTAVLSALGSTTGMATDDPIRVVGAGAAAADLYSEILTVDSGTQVTLKDNAGTTVTGNAVLDPERVTLQHSFTLTSDTNWSIGGWSNQFNDAQLRADVQLPGWSVSFDRGDSSQYVFSSAWIVSAIGDSTDGKFSVIAAVGTQPLVFSAAPRLSTGGSTVDLFVITGKHIVLSGFQADEVRDGVRLDGACEDVTLRGILHSDAVNTFHFTSAVTGSGFRFEGCSGNVLVDGAAKGITFSGCNISELKLANSCGAQYILVEDHLSLGSGVNGIDVGTCTVPPWITVNRAVLQNKTRGIKVADLTGATGMVVTNSQVTNCTTIGLDFPSGSDNVVGKVDFNNLFGNATARAGISAGANDTALDPQYRNTTGAEGEGHDYRTGPAARRKGTPTAFPVAATIATLDIGIQDDEPAGGSTDVRILTVLDLGAQYQVSYLAVNGLSAGVTDGLLVDKTLIPSVSDTTPQVDLLALTIAVALRDQTPQSLVGRIIKV